MKKILRPRQVISSLGTSLPTLWRLIQRGEFVSKIQISTKAVGFYEEDVAAWLENRKSN
jgi:predicted DNA-binding transcriptional regulator AlpA